MKSSFSTFFLLFTGFSPVFFPAYAQLFYNNGASIFTDNGAVVTVNGGMQNASGTIDNNGLTRVAGTLVNDDSITSNGDLYVGDDWLNNGFFTAGTGNVFLDGDTQIVGGVSATTFYNLALQGTGIKQQAINTFISNTLDLGGRELATDVFFMFIQNPDTGAIKRTTGFVSSAGGGKLSRVTNSLQPYLFPTGSSSPSTIYRPVTIKPVSSLSNSFAVRLANSDATLDGYDRNTKEAVLCSINPQYYHRIAHTGGINPADITFYFDNIADGNFSTVAHWQNMPQWEKTSPVSVSINPPPALSASTLSSWNNFTYQPFALANDSLIVSLTSNPSSICPGDSLSVSATSGYNTYNFYLNSSISQSGSNNTFTSSMLNSNDSLYVISTDLTGCSGQSNTFIPTVNPVPVASITPLDTTVMCSGDSIRLQSSVNTGNEWLLNGAPTGDTAQIIYIYSGGTYKDVITNSYGCSDTSDAIIITVNPKPIATIAALDTTTMCNGDTSVLQSSNSSGNLWFYNGTSTGITNQNLSATDSGSYYVVVTNIYSCSDTSGSIAISINPAPVAGIIALDSTTFCANDSSTLQSSSASGNLWLFNGASTGFVTQTITVFNPGIYKDVVTNSYGCSDTSNAITITVNPLPNATISALDTTVFCSGDSVVLQSSVTTGNNWLLNDSAIGMTGQTIAVYITGSFKDVVINNLGCTDTSNEISITVNPLPVASIIALDTTTFCKGDNVILQSSNAAGNNWLMNDTSISATSQNISVYLPGTFKVVVTDFAGCSDTSNSIDVFVNDTPSLNIVSVDTLICNGSASGTASVAAAGGNPPYYYLWNNGQTFSSATGLAAGIYTITVTDANTCTSSLPVIINQNTAISMTVNTAGVSCFGVCDGSAVISYSGGTPPLVFATADTLNDTVGYGQQLTGLCANKYLVFATDAIGCNAVQNFIITSPPPVVAGFSVDSITGYVPLSVVFTDTSTNANTWQWDFGDGDISLVQNPAHAYQDTGWFEVLLRVVSSANCTDTATLKIYVRPLPVISWFIPNVFSPNGDNRNDILYVYGNGIESLYLVIYDRWGEKVYEYAGTPRPSGGSGGGLGWDGTFRGKPCNPDVYVYYLKIKLEGQNETKKEGNITLLK